MNYFKCYLPHIKGDGRIKSGTAKSSSKKILHLIDKNIWDNSGEGHRESSRSMNNIIWVKWVTFPPDNF